MQNNSKNLKILKIIVITMGVLIVLGVITIISTIIYRVSSDDYNLRSDNRELNIKLNIPSDSNIKSVSSNKKTLTIYYELNGKKFVEIINLDTGKNFKSIKLNF